MTAPFTMTLRRAELDVLCAFASDDEARINLHGVGFERRDGRAVAFATDGHRLFVASTPAEGPDLERFIVPLGMMDDARRLLKDRAELFVTKPAESGIRLDVDDWTTAVDPGTAKPPPVWDLLQDLKWDGKPSPALCFNPRLLADLLAFSMHSGWWVTIPPTQQDGIRFDSDSFRSGERWYTALVMPVRMDRPEHAPEPR